MHLRPFPATGQLVSEIGLGTWQLGGSQWGEITDEQALATLAAAAEAGVTFLDTADIYGSGRSEELIGRFLKQPSTKGGSQCDAFFLATKLGRRSDPGWPDNFTRETIFQHTEDSLRRMNIERIDLTQTHCLPVEAMLRAGVFESLADLVRQGKLAAFGASVESVDEAYQCLQVPGLSSLQIIFNIFRQKPLEGLLDEARRRKVAIIVRLPLSSGLLSGQWTAQTEFSPVDHRNFNRDGEHFNVGETMSGLPLAAGVALVDELRPHVPQGITMPQFALRWCLDHPAVTTVIPGSKRPEQARANATASDLPPLSATVHAELRRWYAQRVAPQIRGKY
ncbi:MAG: aldo/keto reductase [Planctomycetia bacterium]|nr:aldo/keto reductase [Planctomycetia bacterium]